MSDLIDREQALKALRGAEAITYAFGYHNVYEAIRRVPSAEPKIIHCGECAFAEVEDLEDVQDGYICQFHPGSIWFSGSFCSWAKAKMEMTK